MPRSAPDSGQRRCKVLNKLGIHARPAAMLVKTAGHFQSDITLEKDGVTVSARSIMGLLTMEGHQGSTIIIKAEGPDAKKALDSLEQLFKDKFNED